MSGSFRTFTLSLAPVVTVVCLGPSEPHTLLSSRRHRRLPGSFRTSHSPQLPSSPPFVWVLQNLTLSTAHVIVVCLGPSEPHTLHNSRRHRRLSGSFRTSHSPQLTSSSSFVWALHKITLSLAPVVTVVCPGPSEPHTLHSSRRHRRLSGSFRTSHSPQLTSSPSFVWVFHNLTLSTAHVVTAVCLGTSEPHILHSSRHSRRLSGSFRTSHSPQLTSSPSFIWVLQNLTLSLAPVVTAVCLGLHSILHSSRRPRRLSGSFRTSHSPQLTSSPSFIWVLQNLTLSTAHVVIVVCLGPSELHTLFSCPLHRRLLAISLSL